MPQLPRPILPIAKAEALNKMNTIEGWLNEDEAGWLWDMASTRRIIVEFGCWMGRSTTVLCMATPGVVFTVDHFQGTPEDRQLGFYEILNKPGGCIDAKATALGNLLPFTKAGKLFLLNLPTSEAGFTLHSIFNARRADMVFIDANHSYTSVLLDIQIAAGLIKAGGLLCGHDYHPGNTTGVVKAVDEYIPRRKTVPGTSLWFFETPPG